MWNDFRAGLLAAQRQRFLLFAYNACNACFGPWNTHANFDSKEAWFSAWLLALITPIFASHQHLFDNVRKHTHAYELHVHIYLRSLPRRKVESGCVHTYKYACIHKIVHANVHTNIHTRAYLCIYTHIDAYIHANMNTQIPSLIMCWICIRHMDAICLHMYFLFVLFPTLFALSYVSYACI